MKGPKKESYYEVQKTKTKKNRLGHNKKKILVLNCIIIIFKSTLKPLKKIGVKMIYIFYKIWGLGFGVWGLGFGVWGLGFEDMRLS